MDDFFDPFDDNLEEVETSDVPNFETSPEIDALDDLDNIDLDLETKIEEPKIEPVATRPEIKKEEIIVEEKIQEVKSVEIKKEEAKIEPVTAVIKEEVKPVEIKVAPVVEEKKPEIKEEENHRSSAGQDIEKAPTNPIKTDLQNKFDELV
jgi:hypothetical protein